MCSGCGKIPAPSFKVPKLIRKPAKEAIDEITAARSVCPSCKKKMSIQPGGHLLCKSCGVSRR